jgi:DnaJ-class molecular chaperone
VGDDEQTQDGEEQPKVDPERAQCTACRGTGTVISNLGGEAKEVPCPWCEGSGRFLPGHDAQQAGPEDAPPAA